MSIDKFKKKIKVFMTEKFNSSYADYQRLLEKKVFLFIENGKGFQVNKLSNCPIISFLNRS